MVFQTPHVHCPFPSARIKNFKNFLKSPDLCKEVAKVGLLYCSHNKGKHKAATRCTRFRLWKQLRIGKLHQRRSQKVSSSKKFQKIFQKPENLQRTCKDHPDIIKPKKNKTYLKGVPTMKKTNEIITTNIKPTILTTPIQLTTLKE